MIRDESFSFYMKFCSSMICLAAASGRYGSEGR